MACWKRWIRNWHGRLITGTRDIGKIMLQQEYEPPQSRKEIHASQLHHVSASDFEVSMDGVSSRW